MQNIDYSKKLKKKSKPSHQTEFYKTTSSDAKSSYVGGLFNVTSNPSGSFLYLFVGALLFFTSGLVIGLKINQNEQLFSNNEMKTNTLKNYGEREFVENSENNKNYDKYPTRSDFLKKNSFPDDLIYPPKQDQVNYIVQVGSFNQNDANMIGKKLIEELDEMQGRLFKTSTGKLYLGYFYSYEQAKVALKKIKGIKNLRFEDASIKKIRF